MTRIVRIIGTLILLGGVLLNSYYGENKIDFVSGILVGIGVGLILTVRLFKKKND